MFIIWTQTSFTQTLSDLSFGTDSTFDIATWNIEWFPKNDTITVDSVTEIIKGLEMDVIACQEIDDTAVFNEMLSHIDGYSGIYDASNFEGLAYIYSTSTVQILDNFSIYTSGSYWRPFPRAPYLLKVHYGNEEFTLINNHLKCCGNGALDTSDIDDEENRRLEASTLLESYISSNLSNSNVVLLGDFNDNLADTSIHNVFQPFFNLPNEYLFVDETIASGTSSNWSYPSWPSHLDHILITNQLFSAFYHPNSIVETIRIDDFFPNGFSGFDADVSDHRPVGLRLFIENPNLGISTLTLEHLVTMFPNPATKTLNILHHADIDIRKVEISNALGQVVHARKVIDSSGLIHLNISSLSPGVYYCTLKDISKNYSTQKLIIE